MKRFIAYTQTHVGRRGAVLLVFSLVFFCIGLKSLIDPADDAGRFVIYTFIPPLGRFIIWTVPALLGVVAALKTFPKRDWYGFAALAIPATVLFVSYLGSFVAHLFHLTPFNTGWVNAFGMGFDPCPAISD